MRQVPTNAITDPSLIIPGETYYYAYGGIGGLEEMVALSGPVNVREAKRIAKNHTTAERKRYDDEDEPTWFAVEQHTSYGSTYRTHRSLKDGGVVATQYNVNWMFMMREDAEAFLRSMGHES